MPPVELQPLIWDQTRKTHFGHEVRVCDRTPLIFWEHFRFRESSLGGFPYKNYRFSANFLLRDQWPLLQKIARLKWNHRYYFEKNTYQRFEFHLFIL